MTEGQSHGTEHEVSRQCCEWSAQ